MKSIDEKRRLSIAYSEVLGIKNMKISSGILKICDLNLEKMPVQQ